MDCRLWPGCFMDCSFCCGQAGSHPRGPRSRRRRSSGGCASAAARTPESESAVHETAASHIRQSVKRWIAEFPASCCGVRVQASGFRV
eukprot:236035-Rhodomonas_salina.2